MRYYSLWKYKKEGKNIEVNIAIQKKFNSLRDAVSRILDISPAHWFITPYTVKAFVVPPHEMCEILVINAFVIIFITNS